MQPPIEEVDLLVMRFSAHDEGNAGILLTGKLRAGKTMACHCFVRLLKYQNIWNKNGDIILFHEYLGSTHVSLTWNLYFFRKIFGVEITKCYCRKCEDRMEGRIIIICYYEFIYNICQEKSHILNTFDFTTPLSCSIPQNYSH